MKSTAIVFEAPGQLQVRDLDLVAMSDDDVLVQVHFSGISTGTERLLWEGSMPPFPGLAYPLVPGYESVGQVVDKGPAVEGLAVGDWVFVPGAHALQGVQNVFGGAAAHLVSAQARVVKLDPEWQAQGVLLALAATAHHVLTAHQPAGHLQCPELIIGHGVMGRLLARLVIATGHEPPVVWEQQALRHSGAQGYEVCSPPDQAGRLFKSICDVSGDATIIDSVMTHLAPGGEVVLAGFYKQALSVAYAPAFMREARIRIAAQWQAADMQAVVDLWRQGRLHLDGLITHTEPARQAERAYGLAFADPACLKMVLDWR
jgi:3-hydroxyethyl bacteriochlorophyllide a dehydrogenase